MHLRTIQWNIGGAKIRKEIDNSEKPTYNLDGLIHIEEKLKEYAPDIVTIEECHFKDGQSEIATVADRLGLTYQLSDEVHESHIEEGRRLGHAILSKYELTKHAFTWYPKFLGEFRYDDGRVEKASHQKGLSGCEMQANNVNLAIFYTQLPSFRKTNTDPYSEQASQIRTILTSKLNMSERVLLQGDFNIDTSSFLEYLPEFFNANGQEVSIMEPTTPRGRKYDHILFKNIKLIHSAIDSSVLTDHFPVITDFEL